MIGRRSPSPLGPAPEGTAAPQSPRDRSLVTLVPDADMDSLLCSGFSPPASPSIYEPVESYRFSSATSLPDDLATCHLLIASLREDIRLTEDVHLSTEEALSAAHKDLFAAQRLLMDNEMSKVSTNSVY